MNWVLVIFLFLNMGSLTATAGALPCSHSFKKPAPGSTALKIGTAMKGPSPAKTQNTKAPPAKINLKSVTEHLTVKLKKRYQPADTGPLAADINFHRLSFVSEFTPPHSRRLRSKRGRFKTAILDLTAVETGEPVKVFLKAIVFNKHLTELSNIQALNKMGIPTLFMGLTQDQSGRFYMVSRFQEGAFFKIRALNRTAFVSGFDRGYRIAEHTRRQLMDLRDRFVQNRVAPGDFQFLLSKTGDVYLIDFEYYRIFGRYNPLFLLFLHKPYVKFEKAGKAIEQEYQKALENPHHPI